MPLDVDFAEPNRFRVRASGPVSYAEVDAVIKQFQTDPRLTGAVLLVDASDVEAVLTTAELRNIARQMMPILDRGLGSIGIVTSNPFAYGVSRMFGVFAESVGARVGAFREFDEAHQWLAEGRTAGSEPSA